MKCEDYEKLKKECEQMRVRLQKQSQKISLYRLIVFAVAALCLICGAAYRLTAGYILGGLLLAAFLFLVRRHDKIEEEQRFWEVRRETAERYICRFNDKWRQFLQRGEEYLAEETPRTRDLDIFGQSSLYQFLCCAGTPYGKARLAEHLLCEAPDKALIEKQQEAVRELADKQAFSIDLQCLAALMPQEKGGAEKIREFVALAKAGVRPLSPALKALMWVLPVLTVFSILLGLIGIQPRLCFAAAALLACVQLLLSALRLRKNNEILKPVFSFHKHVRPYQSVFARVEEEGFESPYLKELQGRIKQDGGAVKALKTLGALGDAVSMRHNSIAFVLYNALLMWDFHCVDQFLEWNRMFGRRVEAWLNAVGELEALISLSVLCNVKETTVFPVLLEQKAPRITCKRLMHPLLCGAVGNDFEMEAGTCVVTGSNMSGKTTFLRSIGISLVLAYAGGPVVAEEFSASVMAVMTSMRIEDSVTSGISTFYAELLRIRGIVEYNRTGKPVLALIDEIFKGTNSRDRVTGAAETVRQLAGPHAVTMLTTHDFELCDLEKEPEIHAVNYHFTEHYEGDEILFDYKIRPGRCKTTNARHLLRMAGILR